MDNAASNPEPTISDELADAAENSARMRLLKRINEETNLPTLGASITKVVEISSSSEDPVAKLAHFVLADVALTQKLLRLSNTIHYRTSSGGTVTTISRAIFLLGFDTIKTSALAMMLVEGFKDKKHAQTVRRELAHALCASIIGRELSQRSRYQDNEEAAIAALFKNVGRILVASFDHPLYQKISSKQLAEGISDAETATDLLGCSYARFSQLALTNWNLPDSIIQALTPLNPGDMRKPGNRNEWLKLVACFSDDLAGVVLRSGETQLSERCQGLYQRFGKLLEIDHKRFDALLGKVRGETRQLAQSMDLALAEIEIADEYDTTLSADLLLQENANLVVSDERFASGKPKHARELLLAGVQDVTQMLASDQFRLNDLILLVLETLYASMGFRFATACIRDLQSERFSARVAVGEKYAERQNRFQFSAKPDQSLFHLALINNVDMMISDASVMKIQNLLPEWHKALLPDARSFIVLPLVVQKNPVGLFYADRSCAADEGVPADEAALIKTLKSQLLAAMVRK